MRRGVNLAFKWFVITAVVASLVMLGMIVWLFSNGESEGAWVMLVALVAGYLALAFVSGVLGRRN